MGTIQENHCQIIVIELIIAIILPSISVITSTPDQVLIMHIKGAWPPYEFLKSYYLHCASHMND